MRTMESTITTSELLPFLPGRTDHGATVYRRSSRAPRRLLAVFR
jgi:hypothetical protein